MATPKEQLEQTFENIKNIDWDKNEEDLRGQKEKNNLAQVIHDSLQWIASRQDERATEEIVLYIKSKFVIYTTKDDLKSEMWVYSDGIYIPNGESLIREITRKILLHAYTPQRANKVIAKIQADTFIEADIFFKRGEENINEQPFNNGILDIFTQELKPFTPEKIFFNKIPVDYVKGQDCPAIKKFFNDVLRHEEDSKVMFELIGFTLLRKYQFEKSFMLVGNGRNGKGKTLGLIKRFLGAENCCSVPLGQMKPESSSVCELFGRLVNIAGDLSNEDLKSTGMFKQLCGRDLINAKRKFLRDLIFVNYAKLCFACNELPRVYDFSEGFWSRWVLLEFPYRFVPEAEYNNSDNKTNLKIEDTEIIDKITTPEELSGLLNEALAGLKRLMQNKEFSYTKGTSEVKNYWIRKSDSFSAFCFDSLEEDYNSSIDKKLLRRKFKEYCDLHKIKGTSDKSMKVTLEDLFGATLERKWNGAKQEQEWVWSGVKFNENNKISQISKEFQKDIEIKNSKTFEKNSLILLKNKNNTLEDYDDSEEKALFQALEILKDDFNNKIPKSELGKIALGIESVPFSLDKLKEMGLVKEENNILEVVGAWN